MLVNATPFNMDLDLQFQLRLQPKMYSGINSDNYVFRYIIYSCYTKYAF